VSEDDPGAHPAERAKELAESAAHGLAHPVETAKELEHEAEVGESPRTPLIAITGVTIVAAVAVVVILAISFTLYFVYGGK
jgi:hypothetical protein